MNTFTRAARFLFALLISGTALSAVAANTVTVTPSATSYSAAGGNLTIAVTLSYTGSLAGLDFELKTPVGWKFTSVSGTNVPQIAPTPDDLGAAGLAFAYSSIPTASASFSFVVSYPANLTGDQVLSFIKASFTADDAASTVSVVNVANITISPAPTPPTISSSPSNQTVTSGQNATFTVAASGNPVPTFVWQKSTDAGANWSDLSNGGRISGATAATLTITGALSTDAASYRAVATNGVGSPANSAAATLTVNKANQTITFGALAPTSFGAGQITLNATASSGLGVTYTSSNPAVALVSGNTITVGAVGTATITASQSGNSEFNAAVDATQVLSVGKATASVTLAGLAQTFNNSPRAVTATTNPAGLAVGITYDGGATAPTNVGSYAVVATINDASFTGSANGTLVISKADQTITFAALTPVTFKDPNLTLSATATSGLGVSFTSSNPAVATISGTTLTITGAGNATITASQIGSANYNAAPSVNQVLVVNKAAATVSLGSLAATFDGTPKAATSTTTPSGLVVNFTYDGNVPPPINAGTYAVVGTVVDPNYAGSASGSLVIAKAPQTITFAALDSRPFNDPDFLLTGTSTSGLPLTYTSSDPTVASVNGNIVDLLKTGTTTITASHPGNENFLPATSVSQVLTVLNAGQTITFAGTELAGKTFGDAPFPLAATASSGLLVSFVSSDANVATISGSTLTITGAGNATITAKQAGDSNFAAAPDQVRTLSVAKKVITPVLAGLSATYDGSPKSVTATTTPAGLTVAITYDASATAPTNVGSYAIVATINDTNYAGTASGTLVISKANQTITFGALTPVTFNDPSFNLTATASSTLGVTFTSSNPAVASVTGSTVTITGAGSATITASQSGNANFNAAPSVDQVLLVNKASATVTLGGLAATFDGTPKTATATTNPAGRVVTFTYDGNPPPPINAGTYAVVGTVVDPNYMGTASGSLVIAKAPQTITFAALDSKPFNDPDFPLTGTSTSGLPLVYTSSDPTVATVTGNIVDLLKTGTTTITASHPGNENFLPATSVTQVLTVLNAGQTITFAGTELTGKTFGDAPFPLSATASSTLPVSFVSSDTAVATISGNLVTILSAGNTTITAKQAGDSNFAAAPDVPRTLTVAKKVATGTLNDLAQVFDTTPRPVTATTVPAGLMVMFTYGGAPTPPINVGSYAVVGTIMDLNYTGTINGTLVVSKAAQTITFAALPTKVLSPTPFALTATSSSGLPVSYTSSNTAVATISGNMVTTVATGTATITASQAGDANYNAATNVTQTLTVNPVAPVIISTPPLAATAVQGRSFLFGPITINNTPATFSATGLPAGLTVNPTLGTISGSPTSIPTPNPATIVLTATNVTGSDSRTITLTVQAPPPVITSAASTSGRVGTAFTFNVTASNSPTSFAANNLPAGLSIDTATGAITGTPTAAGSSSVQITVTNASGSVTQPLFITIEPPLNAPVYTGPTALSGTQGSAFTFTPAFGTVTAPYALTGTLPAGLTFTAATGVIAGTPTQTGNAFLTLSATNAGGTTSVNLTLVINPAPAAPVITSSGIAPNARVGTAFSFQLTSTGTPAASSYTANNLPAGVTLAAATGLISGTPTAFGTFHVAVSATNTVGTGPTSTLVISVAPSASAPVISSSPIILGQANVPLTGVSLAANPAATSFAITNGALPSGLTLNTTTGAITGTPTAAGDTRVWFAGTNASGTGLALEVLFSIAPAASTPVVNSNGTAVAQVGQPFQYVITASNGPITAFGANGRPAWLSLDNATGVLSGIPTEATTEAIQITLTATNAGGTGNPKTLRLTVAPAPATPVITSSLAAAGRVGTAFSYQITASETPTSFVATGLPAGLVLNSTTGVISGTPTVSNTFNVSLRGANAGGLGAPSTLVIEIAPSVSAPAITSDPTATAQVGAAFTYQIVATNGPILSYNAGSKELPSGLTLNTATGVISGSPSADPRTYLVTITATNAGGTSLPQVLAINVTPALGVPVVSTPLYVVGTVGVDFSLTIAASNLTGSAPYAPPIVLEAVGLPPGLAVNPSTGVIAGKPTAVGTTVATLSATNAAGTGPTRDLTIFVLPAPTAPVVGGAAVAVGQVNEPFTYQIVASNSPTSYEVLNSPVWITLNPVTGAVTGVPTSPGTFTVQLTASNAAGTSSPALLGLFISPAANTPVVTSTRTATGTVGTPFTYTPAATPAATGYVASGLPRGLGINATTGEISGTPNVNGTFNVILTPSNANGVGAPVTIVITILSNVTFGG